ncbi:MAG: 2-C-methyl-D-erythritol 4-phosphate cytidylyltransferase [bacterium]|nr:2-C-methyl-D-erythritol 4-phosphate cytidylyltransferase [bacterium]
MPAPTSIAALVLGAGRGERLGHALPKAFVPLAGRTLIERSIRALSDSGAFCRIQPVLAESEFERFDRLGLVASVEGVVAPVEGGKERQDSMWAGLAVLPGEIEFVAVHDAARCLVSEGDLRAVVVAAQEEGAAILAERSRDTLKRVAGGRVVETPAREEYWAAQTPQVVRRDWLVKAVEAAVKAGRSATDDAQLVEWMGHPVRVVEARSPNPKITRAEDLLLAEALLGGASGAGDD